MKRADALIVRVVVTDYGEDGVPVSETLTPPTKVFLAHLPSFLASMQAEVAALNEPPPVMDGQRSP